MTLSFFLGLLLSVAIGFALIPLAVRIGLVDKPDARKRHQGLVPLAGGVSMFLAYALVALMTGTWNALPKEFHLGALMLLTIGVLDDRWPLPSIPRFVLQALTLWMVVDYTGNVLTNVGMLVSPAVLELGPYAVAFTVFGYLGVVNSVNLIDGADGLAGGVAFTALVSFLVVLFLIDPSPTNTQFVRLRVELTGLIGAVAGFLCFNLRGPWRKRASMFMGDAGSLFLGFVLGWFAIFVCGPLAGPNHLPAVYALWILIVPLIDTVSCMIRRILSGKSPMAADRQHLHHLLQAWGLSPSVTVAAIIGLNAAGGAIAVVAWQNQVPDYWMFAALLLVTAVYMVVAMTSWRHFRRRDAELAGQLS